MRIRGFTLTLVLAGITVEAQPADSGCGRARPRTSYAHRAPWHQLAFAAAS